MVPAGATFHVKPKRDSDLLIERFAARFVWIERDGVTTHGKRPEWLDYPMVRGDEIARESWNPKRK
jgi:hypothetical protein